MSRSKSIFSNLPVLVPFCLAIFSNVSRRPREVPLTSGGFPFLPTDHAIAVPVNGAEGVWRSSGRGGCGWFAGQHPHGGAHLKGTKNSKQIKKQNKTKHLAKKNVNKKSQHSPILMIFFLRNGSATAQQWYSTTLQRAPRLIALGFDLQNLIHLSWAQQIGRSHRPAIELKSDKKEFL